MDYKVHRFQASDMGLAVNAFLIETAKSVIVVDATLLKSDSVALLQKIQNLGKPISAIFITHGHPDHIAGLATLSTFGNPPIYALQSIVDLMEKTEAAKHAQWSSTFGEDWITKWVYPNHIVKDGDTINIDGLQFTVYDIGGGGDCEANSIWMMENGSNEAFVGDIIFNDNFTYMNDGQILRWLANLDHYKPLLKTARKLHIGHGLSVGIEMVETQKNYLNDYCTTLLGITKGKAELDEEMTNQFVEKMEKKYPTYGLNFMVGLSAGTVAGELS